MGDKINDVTISVTLNGSEVSREFKQGNLDNFDEMVMGHVVVDMLNTLREADKNVGL